MKEFFKYIFYEWWQPILFWFLSCLIFGLCNKIFENFAILLFVIGLFVILISAISSFSKRKLLTVLLGMVFFGGLIFTFFAYLTIMFWYDQNSPDEFAKNLKIPENITLENPVNTSIDENYKIIKPENITNKKVTTIDFQLYNSIQPGLYEYDLWIGKIERGTIYIKAFEITHEYALSTSSLTERSSIKIYNPTDRILKFETLSDFTIYEGDWGEPYGARFEIWFKPNKGGKERKLLTKYYKIEGWMR
jgi:hypothetical protein